MNTVVEFKPARTVITIGDQTVIWPTTRAELLQACKRFLTEDDYCDLLCGILDAEIFEEIDEDLQGIVEAYLSFPN